MKFVYKYIFLMSIALFFSHLSSPLAAKIIPESELDSAFIYLIAKNTTWPQEKNIKAFHIALVDDNPELLKTFKKLTKGLRLKGKKIDVQTISLHQLYTHYTHYQLVYLSVEYTQYLENFLKKIPKETPLLVISNESDDTDSIMVNLYLDNHHKKNLQINLQNILQHRLHVSNEVILTGGKELGISKLFQSSLIALKRQENAYVKYKRLNKNLEQKVKQYEQEVKQLHTKLLLLHRDVSAKEESLREKISKLREKNQALQKVMDELSLQRTVLAQQEKQNQHLVYEYQRIQKQFHVQQEKLAIQNSNLQQREDTIKKKELIIASLDKKIDQQMQQINLKELLLQEQTKKIQMQSVLLVLIGVIGVLLAFLAWIMYRNKQKMQALNEELKEAKERAEYANQSKSMFIANMSHELRTPLNAIIGFSQLLSQDETIPEEKRNLLMTIYKSGVFLLSMINDILDLSKIEARKIILHPVVTELDTLVSDLMMWLGSRAEEKGLRLELAKAVDAPSCIVIDADKLKQVLINLIINAIKYSQDGVITLCVESDKKYLYIEVRDQGVGIKQEDLETIFKPFAQVGDASDMTGAGLGLTITQKFVEAMDGEITVESELSKGSVFRVKLPYRVSHMCKANAHKMFSDSVVGIYSSKGEISLVVIDKNRDNRQLLQMALSKIGIVVTEFSSFSKAYEYLKSHQCDMIWIEKNLLFTYHENFQSINFSTATKIIAMSASVNTQEENRYKELGVDDYILKPFTLEDIYKMVQKHLPVELVYEEEKKENKKDSYKKEELCSQLEKISPQLLDTIYEAAVLLNVDEFHKVVNEVKKQDKKLAKMLLYFADKLLFDVILEAITTLKQKN